MCAAGDHLKEKLSMSMHPDSLTQGCSMAFICLSLESEAALWPPCTYLASVSLASGESPDPVLVQVALLWDGLERGRMYAAYALSALMTPQSPVDSLLAAGVVPALLNVLQTSRVSKQRLDGIQGS